MIRTVGFTSPWVTFASAGQIQRVVHITGNFTPNVTRADAQAFGTPTRAPLVADVSAPPPAPGTCPACNGRGHHNEVTCEVCYGRGVVP